MKRALLLATTTGYQIRSFADAAQALDVRLQFVSDRCDQLDDPWWDQAIPVRFYDLDASIEAVVNACSGAPPHAILAVGDRPTMLAAALNQVFGLAGHPPAATARCRNKLDAHAALKRAGLLVAAYHPVSLREDPHDTASRLSYPVVLKPLALSGSRGVMRANDAEEFVRAFTRLRALMNEPDIRLERDAAHDGALVESFIPGAEYAVEGVITRGAFHPFAIFDKPDPLDGPFFEETIYVTPSRSSSTTQSAIVRAVSEAATALGLYHGPVHAECRVNERGVYVLEVAARPIGGLCSKALRLVGRSGPASLEEVLLRHALGEDVSSYQRENAASAVMMIPIPRRGVLRGVAGVDLAKTVAGVDEVRITAKHDAVLVPLPEGRSYLGFIFAHGVETAAAEGAVRDAHAQLRFEIERELPVI